MEREEREDNAYRRNQERIQNGKTEARLELYRRKKEKNAQKLVDKMQQEHASTVTNKNKADDALKQAQEFAKQATPEKIKNAENINKK